MNDRGGWAHAEEDGRNREGWGWLLVFFGVAGGDRALPPPCPLGAGRSVLHGFFISAPRIFVFADFIRELIVWVRTVEHALDANMEARWVRGWQGRGGRERA